MVAIGLPQDLCPVYPQALDPDNDARFHLVEWNIYPLRKCLVAPVMFMHHGHVFPGQLLL